MSFTILFLYMAYLNINKIHVHDQKNDSQITSNSTLLSY